MKISSNFISTAFFYFTAYCGFQIYNDRMGFGIGIVMMFVSMLIGITVQHGHEKAVQNERDKFAEDVYTKISSTAEERQIPDYLLYLRPFETTNNLPMFNTGFVDSTGGAGAMLPGAYEAKYFDLETRIADCLSIKLGTIGLGKPGEAFGAGRLPTEEKDWKKAVSKLIRYSKHIVVVAGPHGGTMWEIKHILSQGYLRKTTFVMPPKPDPKLTTFNWHKYNEGLEEAFSHIKMPLPEFDEKGVLFWLDNDKSILESKPIPYADKKDKNLRGILLYKLS